MGEKYSDDVKKALNSSLREANFRPPLLVGYSSGQRGETVNLLVYTFTGSNPVPTTT